MNLRHSDFLKQGMALVGKVLKPLREHGKGILIVNYHSVSDEGNSIVRISPAMFHEQIRWLANHYEIVSLEAAIRSENPAQDVVVITFDDGYADYMTTAVPWLVQENIPSTVYVITDLILNPDKPYPMQAGTGKRSMSMRDIEELRNEPLVTIGSHTHTHRNLKQLPESEVAREMETSYAILAQALGKSEIHFSYPWADASPTADALAKKTYKTAVIGKGSKNLPPMNLYGLKRIPAKREPHSLFVERIQENLFLEYTLRELLG